MLIQNYRRIKINRLCRVSAGGSHVIILPNRMHVTSRLIFIKCIWQSLCFDSEWSPSSNCFVLVLYGTTKWRCIELFRKYIVLLCENGLGRGKFIAVIWKPYWRYQSQKSCIQDWLCCNISLCLNYYLLCTDVSVQKVQIGVLLSKFFILSIKQRNFFLEPQLLRNCGSFYAWII